jgi:hypothetical protein
MPRLRDKVVEDAAQRPVDEIEIVEHLHPVVRNTFGLLGADLGVVSPARGEIELFGGRQVRASCLVIHYAGPGEEPCRQHIDSNINGELIYTIRRDLVNRVAPRPGNQTQPLHSRLNLFIL